LRKHREETEAATKANKTSKSHDEETELSMDDVFRSSPSRAPGKLDKSWSGFSPSKRTKGRLPDVGSVPDGLVSTLLNEHGKIEKSGDNVYSRRHQEELNKSIGKGLVAQRLAKAKANDSSGVPSMFSYF
jgi:hypothetical protein